MSLLNPIRKLVPYRIKKYVHRGRHYGTMLRARRRYALGESVWASALAVFRLALRPERTVLFYPDLPGTKQIIHKACALNGYRMTRNPQASYDIVHKHKDRTVSEAYELVKAAGRQAINAESNDIRKSTVQAAFETVFGYRLAVNPRSYDGKALRKSESNAMHDGVIIDCPYMPADEGDFVYQKLIDTETAEGVYLEYRVPIIGGQVPLVYLRRRPAEGRFVPNKKEEVELAEPDRIFSEIELGLLSELAATMGVDFGEMDVLRDNKDGRIYVVDINNTPSGPPRRLEALSAGRAAAVIAAHYRSLVNNRVD